MVWDAAEGCEHVWGDKLVLDKRGISIGKATTSDARQETRGQFCQLCNAWRGQLGLEPDIDLYISHLMEIVDETHRVLRPDGVFLINLGDSYAGSGGAGGDYNYGGLKNGQPRYPGTVRSKELKTKDLCNVPHRVAAEMQRRGWYWRSTIIWAKGREGDDELYKTVGPGSSMPDSVNGWRWERCRVKVRKGNTSIPHNEREIGKASWTVYSGQGTRRKGLENPQWADCPGCSKCLPHDGYVLRKGAWRPAKAHEYLFLMAKGPMSYGDDDAVRVEWSGGSHRLRDVWLINTKSYKGSHFATFAPALVERCIKAATSERGVCPECGSQYARVVETASGGAIGQSWHDHQYDEERGAAKTISNKGYHRGHTLGWRPSCDCQALAYIAEHRDDFPRTRKQKKRIAQDWSTWQSWLVRAMNRAIELYGASWQNESATVLDMFVGSGTTIQVARQLGRRGIGVECVEDYIRLAIERLGGPYEVETEDGAIVRQEQLW